MTKDIDIAKQIFLKFDGSHFHMEREGEYSYYKSFDISKEQEDLWIKQYQEDILSQIEKEDIVSPLFTKLVRIIAQHKDYDCLNSLLDLVKRKKNGLDSFTRVRIAEELLELYESFQKSGFNRNRNIFHIKVFSIDLLKELLEQPITVANYYYGISYLKEEIKEESIKDRAKHTIDEWESR